MLAMLNTAKTSIITALIAVLLLAGAYFAMEPSILAAQASDSGTFTIQQTIGDAISITVPSSVAMVGTIDGVAGGNATGTAEIVVSTNDPDGYSMTISFENATSSMRGNTTGSVALRDYNPVDLNRNTPDYEFSVATTAAQFAYTVNASSSGDVVQLFRDNDTSCNQGAGSPDINKCWFRPSDANVELINRTSAASDGATSTIKFKVVVPNAPSPALQADIYTATATLTATNNI